MKKIILISAICAICTQAQSQSWNLTGNAGTNPSTNFIGTTDAKALKIRTNNNVHITISSSGKVGIGIASPVFKLDVKGGSINTDSVYRIGGNTVLSAKGTANIFVGIKSGFFNTTGQDNTANGYKALYSNTKGNYNTANGSNALLLNTKGNFNTASGESALYSNTEGNDNTANGEEALLENTTASMNTAIGGYALNNQSYDPGFVWSSNNVAVGHAALFSNEPTSTANGINNTAIGTFALSDNTTGFNNTGIGLNALYLNSTGFNNTATGYNAIYANTTGSYNSALGTYAYFTTGALDNTSCLGYSSGGIVNASNRIELGNTSVSVIAGEVGFSTYSDMRIKDNIKEDVPGLAFISKLRPVTYNLNVHRENAMMYKGTKKDEADWHGKYDIEKIKMTGFLAQDVEKAAREAGYDFSGVQKPANPGELYSLRYSDFVMPLVKAVQELSKMNDEKDALIQQQQQQIIDVMTRLDRLEKSAGITNIHLSSMQIDKLSAGLEQNTPNPFDQSTNISYTLPAKFVSAQIIITDQSGKVLKQINISTIGKGMLNVQAGSLAAGTYNYSLAVDGNLIDTKKMERLK